MNDINKRTTEFLNKLILDPNNAKKSEEEASMLVLSMIEEILDEFPEFEDMYDDLHASILELCGSVPDMEKQLNYFMIIKIIKNMVAEHSVDIEEMKSFLESCLLIAIKDINNKNLYEAIPAGTA